MKDPRSELSKLLLPKGALDKRRRESGPQLKALQRLKIRELRDALVDSGVVTLAAQAEALGLRRSTTWAILQANHKASGLSAATISRMLQSPRLPPRARTAILEYVAEKAAGSYGATTMQRRKFASRLSIAQIAAFKMAPMPKRDMLDAGIQNSDGVLQSRARLSGHRPDRVRPGD